MITGLWLLLTAAMLCWPRPAIGAVRLSAIASTTGAMRVRAGAHAGGPDGAGPAAGAPPDRLPGSIRRWPRPAASTLARLPTRTARVLIGTAASGGVALGLLLGPPAVGLAAGLVLAALLHVALGAARTRSETRDGTELIAAVSMIEAELSVGALDEAALTAGAAVSSRYRQALLQAARSAASGGDVATALIEAGQPALGAVASAWRVRARCGAALAHLLADVRRDLELSQARHREVAAVLAGPRSSALLLAGLPVLAIGLGSGLGADPVGFLTSPGAGSIVLLIGVAADVAGVAWTGSLVRRALQ